MNTDIEISQKTKLEDIGKIGKKLGLEEKDLIRYGNNIAKIDISRIKDKKEKGRLILVTSINPTPSGEGKTTVNIGLSMAINKLGYSSISTLREPSLGPSFGLKGGAAGGGYSQVLPMEDINLHFTGDFHAITSANNLIASMLDNHIHQGNRLQIDTRKIVWNRILDINDRALRKVVIGLGGKNNSIPREDSFDITVASEIMAAFCLSDDLYELKERIGRMIIAYNIHGEPIYVKDIEAEGAATLLLKDSINPNLAQTTEHTPAIIHGGPFANIAHGCNSIIATKTSMNLCDYTVTEAGFGADLGAEKFFNIKCKKGNLKPNVSVVVVTIKALKYHGGVDKNKLDLENVEAVKKGFDNLEKHLENLSKFNIPIVVTINKYKTDRKKEIDLVKRLCAKKNIKAIESNVWEYGSEGALELAKEVVSLSEKESNFKPLYDDSISIKEKISMLVKDIYGGKNVSYSRKAERKIREIEKMHHDKIPVCMAKTQYSLSDNAKLRGRPENFTVEVKDIKLSNGAGFIVVFLGSILTMPGLPKVPAASNMDIDKEGNIKGLF